MEIYKTSDFFLGCFLSASGLMFDKIEWNSETKRCNFCFLVPEGMNLIELLSVWSSSDSDFLRTLLHKNKQLKKNLADFLKLNNNPNVTVS